MREKNMKKLIALIFSLTTLHIMDTRNVTSYNEVNMFCDKGGYFYTNERDNKLFSCYMFYNINFLLHGDEISLNSVMKSE